MSRRYDLVVLGGGTAGLVSATIAAGIGARVALIERDRTGGDCLWTGCVPSKSLIAAAGLAHRMRHADAVGLTPTEPEIDFARVMDRVHGAIAAIEPADSPDRLRAAGVEVVTGDGRFTSPDAIEVAGRELRFTSALAATGSSPATPELPGIDPGEVLTSDSVWDLRERPQRLVVLGGGPIGCELAQAFARLGSSVVLVEAADRLLGAEEPEAGALVAACLAEDGVDVRLGARAVSSDGDRLVLTSGRGDTTIAYDRILAAVGRQARTAGLGLDAAGVRLGPGGAIDVDARLRTSSRRIYAAGDVTGLLPFTHVAAHHARIATINALFGARGRVSATLPRVTFTAPEVAAVGLTAAAARERWGGRATMARSDYAELDRAITDGTPRGFALLVGDPRGRLVGATVAAPGAGEAIAELTARVAAGDRIGDLSTTVHAYPTLAEGPSRAADDHLRRRYAAPAYRRLARPVLLARRLLAAR